MFSRGKSTMSRRFLHRKHCNQVFGYWQSHSKFAKCCSVICAKKEFSISLLPLKTDLYLYITMSQVQAMELVLQCDLFQLNKHDAVLQSTLYIKVGKSEESHLTISHYRDGCLVSLRHHHFFNFSSPFFSPPKNFAPREISSRILKYKYSKTINIPETDKK